MEPYETLELTREDGSAWITLNRPDRLNALTGEMYFELEWEANAIAMAVSTPAAREAFAAFKAQKAR